MLVEKMQERPTYSLAFFQMGEIDILN